MASTHLESLNSYHISPHSLRSSCTRFEALPQDICTGCFLYLNYSLLPSSPH